MRSELDNFARSLMSGFNDEREAYTYTKDLY